MMNLKKALCGNNCAERPGCEGMAGETVALTIKIGSRKSLGALVRKAGFEPARPCGH